ncbi:MAG: hypothetical protein Kow00128_15430 [Deltaproteobacteria bacterium]
MKPANVHRFAVVLAFALLPATAAVSYGGDPSGRPDGSDAFTASNPGAGPSLAPGNTAMQDNAAAVSAVPPAEEPETPAAAAGDAGEEAALREPSFGKESPPVVVHDPIEPVNRGIFYVNDKLYRWLFRPVAKGYNFLVPEWVRIVVRNFFLNLGTPVRVANTLLQGKFKATGTELARFTINSTIGMAGLFDPAKDWNLRRKDEDTGQTLGVYGFGHGMYCVLPILGPTSARDAVGLVGDAFLDPLTYISDTDLAIGAYAFRSETNLSFKVKDIDELTGAAVDPYIAVRDAYIQSREKRVWE